MAIAVFLVHFALRAKDNLSSISGEKKTTVNAPQN